MQSIDFQLKRRERFDIFQQGKAPGNLFHTLSQKPPNLRHQAPDKLRALLALAIIKDNRFYNEPTKITEVTRKIFPNTNSLTSAQLTNVNEYKQSLRLTQKFVDTGEIDGKDLFASDYIKGSRTEVREKIISVIRANGGKIIKSSLKNRIKQEKPFRNINKLFEAEFSALREKDKICKVKRFYFIKE